MAEGNKYEIILDGDDKPLSDSLDRAGRKLRAFQRSTVPGATQAMTNFNRVVQDAPFGFMGIANNLDPLLESFGRLKTETGSTGAALKAMASSMLGPAGLGLALASISSLAIVAVQRYGSIGAAVNEVFGLYDKAAKAAADFNKNALEAAAGVEGEITKINALISIARDDNRARDSRLQAIRALNKEYDRFLPNLTIENVATQKVTESIDKLTKSLVRNAQIKGLQDLISKEASKQAEAAAAAIDNTATGFDKFLGILKDAVDLNGIDAGTERLYKLGQAFDAAGKRGDLFKKFLNDLLGQSADESTLVIDEIKVPKEKVGKSLEQLFFKINESAGENWQKLIEESEKGRDLYYSEWEKQIGAADKRQKIIDVFNRTNEAIRKGIVGLQPGGSLDPFAGQEIHALDKRLQIEQKIRAFGATPRDTSYLSDESAKLLLLNKQWEAYQQNLAVSGLLVSDFLQPAFRNLFEGLAAGTQSAGDLLKGFFTGLVKQIAVTIAQAAALAGIMQLLGLGGGMSFGALFKRNLGIPNVGGIGSATSSINVTGMLRGADIFLAGQRGGASMGRIGYG